MSLLDEVIAESQDKNRSEPTPTINGGSSLGDYMKWMERLMKGPSPLDRAVKEVRVEDMGIMTYAAVDKDGIPVAFYGEECRQSMLKYAENNA